jgi:hypothetical protein
MLAPPSQAHWQRSKNGLPPVSHHLCFCFQSFSLKLRCSKRLIPCFDPFRTKLILFQVPVTRTWTLSTTGAFSTPQSPNRRTCQTLGFEVRTHNLTVNNNGSLRTTPEPPVIVRGLPPFSLSDNRPTLAKTRTNQTESD